MKPKSDNLFHFTKTIQVLKLILKNGIEPRMCLEDMQWLSHLTENHIAFPMSCFCDIPLSRISEHTDFYGSYGIGLSKEWGLKNKLNPVIYSPTNGTIQKSFGYYYKKYEELNQENDSLYLKNTYALWALIKPIVGKMVIGGEFIEKEFYQENEWRYVPPVEIAISDDVFEEEKEKCNEDIKKFTLKLTPTDIKYIFVKTDNDIPELVDYINTEMGNFPHNDLKILQSRITSLETLSDDL